MKCYKCKSEIGLIGLMQTEPQWLCIVCAYKISRNYGKAIMPFTITELQKIRTGKKWTHLCSLKYDKYPFGKIKVHISNNGTITGGDYNLENWLELVIDISISECYKTKKELITAYKKKGFKFPQEMWLYDLRKPI